MTESDEEFARRLSVETHKDYHSWMFLINKWGRDLIERLHNNGTRPEQINALAQVIKRGKRSRR